MQYIYLLITIVFGYGANSLVAQASKADSLKRAGNYIDALAVCKQNIEKDSKQADFKELCADYNEIANVYANMGDYQKSTDYYFKALRLAEERKDEKALAFINYNIGLNYGTMHQDSFGLVYLNRAIKTLLQMDEPEYILGDCYMAVGGMCGRRHDYKSALDNLKLAEDLFKKNNRSSQLANVYVNQSYLELNRENYKAVIEPARKALSLFISGNDRLGIAVSYINLQVANYNMIQDPKSPNNKKELRQCIAFLDSATHAISGMKSPEHFIVIYQNKTELYEYLGNIDSAYRFLMKYVDLKESVYNLDTQKQIQDLRIQYEAEAKEKDNLLLKQENKALAIDGERKTLMTVIAVTSGAFLLLLIIFIVYRNNARKKQKETEFEKSKLELEQKTLRAQMNPHFLFNAINSIQRYILKKNQQKAYDYLAKFSKLIRIVLHNSQEKALTLQQELEMIKLYIEMEQLRFNDSFEFKVQISEEIDEHEITVPAMLIQPYIENAIWHGLMNLQDERKGLLKLEVSANAGVLKIVIEDNGIGRAKAKTYNTDEKHKSVGMRLTEERLLMISKMQEYGNASVIVMDLTDNVGEDCGTRVEISLPINEK